MAAKKTQTNKPALKLPEGFNPFQPKPGQEEMQKAYWAAHWANSPSSGELYEGEL